MRKQNGFTLIEVLVASIIFGLVILGLSSVFVAGSKQLIHARERVISAELAKFFIDPLQNQVNQSTWPGSNFEKATGSDIQEVPQTINNRGFSGSYKISVVTDLPNVRRVTTKIVWNEPTS